MLYGDDSSQSQSSIKDLGDITEIEGQNGKEGMCQGGKRVAGKLHSFYIVMKACGSPNQNGRVVNGVCVLYGSRLSITSQVRYYTQL